MALTCVSLRGTAACIGIVLAMLTAACGGSPSSPPADQADAAPAPAATEPAAPDSAAVSEDAPSDAAIEQALAPWTGDLDGMVERRYIRMLVTFSRTNYFLDLAHQQGATYDAAKLFEETLNRQLKTKNIRVQIMFIPVSRDRLFADLAAGRGDIAAANLTITPERQKLVDFSTPVLNDVKEVVVTAQGEPPITSVEDLAGRQVHVRRSSAYFTNLTELNNMFRAKKLAPITIVEASEALEDEDLLEMVNAGLMPATVVDDHLAGFWSQIFEQIRVSDVAIKSGASIAWAVRKNTPQLRAAVDTFLAANQKGS